MGGGSEIATFAWRSHNIEHDWKAWCRTWGKYWCFQLEKGEETGKLHMQGVISLKVRRTVGAAKKIMKMESVLPEYFAPLSNGARGGSEAFYVTKPETRVEGPWSDKDKEVFVPYQYEGILERMRPYQQKIWDSADIREPRKVHVIVDKEGHSGKSSIAALMDIYGRGYDLPPINDSEKLIQSVCDILMAKEDRDPKCMFFDLTRSQKQDALFGLYVSIKQVKKGKVYDLRYAYKEWWFHSPQVWVLCNEAPKKKYLSRDRWNLWTINHETWDLELLPQEA